MTLAAPSSLGHPRSSRAPGASLPRLRSQARELLDFVRRAVAEHAGAPGLLAVTIPDLTHDPLPRRAQHRSGRLDRPTVFWADREGTDWDLGVGASRIVRARGEARFHQLASKADAVFSRLRVETHPECPSTPPRLWGGLSFVPGSADQAPWSSFGDAAFFLPRTTQHFHNGQRRLSLTFDLTTANARLEANGRLQALSRYLLEVSAASRPLIPNAASRARVSRLLVADTASRAAFAELVSTVLASMPLQGLEKVVLARRVELLLGNRIDPVALLERLASHSPETTAFALGFEGSLFVGMSPERLVARRGRSVWSEALAGTWGNGQRVEERTAEKLGREHRAVVEHLVQRLRPLCDALHWTPRPESLTTGTVRHLKTPVTGLLRRPIHVLELAARLHPTPAVAGVPQRLALDELLAREPAPRGWYAGPVGWFSADGDGELAVALRCALVESAGPPPGGVEKPARAWLWAGAGIVRGSNPTDEAAETHLKLLPMRAILEQTMAPPPLSLVKSYTSQKQDRNQISLRNVLRRSTYYR